MLLEYRICTFLYQDIKMSMAGDVNDIAFERWVISA